MARKAQLLLASEQASATEAEYDATPDSELQPLGDRDSEDAWDSWISALKEAEATGTVRAYKLPTDESGNPMLGKGTRQITLGAWPHQLYAPDQLEAKIVREFMKPGETAHIKFTGTSAGSRGVVFSRIVTLQKADAPVNEGSQENVGSLFKIVQEGQAAQLQTLREIFQPAQQAPVVGSSLAPIMKDVLTIGMPIVGSIISALIARPKPQTDIGALIGAMSEMKSFISGEPTDREEGSTTATIIKAVAPALPQLLQLLNNPTNTAQRPTASAQRQLPAPVPTVDATRPTVVVSQPAPAIIKPPVSPVSTTNIPPSRLRDSDAVQPEGLSDVDLQTLKTQIEQLAQLAEQNVDPLEVAQLVLTTVPEAIQDQIASLVETPMNFQRLALLSPKIKLHAEWFEKLRLALFAEFFEPDEQASVSHLKAVPGSGNPSPAEGG